MCEPKARTGIPRARAWRMAACQSTPVIAIVIITRTGASSNDTSRPRSNAGKVRTVVTSIRYEDDAVSPIISWNFSCSNESRKTCRWVPFPLSTFYHLGPFLIVQRGTSGTTFHCLKHCSYLTNLPVAARSRGLPSTVPTSLVTLASRRKARIASTVKMIACARWIQNQVSDAPVCQIKCRCVS